MFRTLPLTPWTYSLVRLREWSKTRKRENATTRKPENAQSRNALFAESNKKTLQSIELAIKDGRRWEEHKKMKTRKRENGKKCSRFLVVWFCTEAVHSAALWTRRLSQLWACVKYVPSSPFHSTCSTLNTTVITALVMCKWCTETVHSVALWTRYHRFGHL